MDLDSLQWNLLRTFLLNALIEAALDPHAFAQALRPWLARATLYRFFEGKDPSPEHAQVMVHAGGRFLGFDPWRVQRMLADPCRAEWLQEAELACGQSYRCDTAEFEPLNREFDRAVAASDRLAMAADLPPSFFFDEAAIDDRVSYLAQRWAQKPEQAFAAMRPHLQRRREEYMNFGALARLKEIVVLTPLSSLGLFKGGVAPFPRQSDLREAAYLTFLHDSIAERNARPRFIDDIREGKARRWWWSREPGTTAIFDCGILVRHPQHRLACRVVRAGDGPIAGYVFGQRMLELQEGQKLACHGSSKHEIVGFLQSFWNADRRPGGTSLN